MPTRRLLALTDDLLDLLADPLQGDTQRLQRLRRDTLTLVDQPGSTVDPGSTGPMPQAVGATAEPVRAAVQPLLLARGRTAYASWSASPADGWRWRCPSKPARDWQGSSSIRSAAGPHGCVDPARDARPALLAVLAATEYQPRARARRPDRADLQRDPPVVYHLRHRSRSGPKGRSAFWSGLRSSAHKTNVESRRPPWRTPLS
jgi:hypothetical protein